MSPSWRRLGRVAAVFAVVGWLVAVSIGATEADVSWRAALADPVHLRALLVGLLATVAWGPVWVHGRPPLWLGPVLGLVAGVCSVYLYFFAFPHEWQGSRPMAWKSTKVVVGTYYRWLLPYFLLGGAACSWWVARPVAARGWEKLADDGEDLPTAGVAPLPSGPSEGATAQLPGPATEDPTTRPVPPSARDRLREGTTVPLPGGPSGRGSLPEATAALSDPGNAPQEADSESLTEELDTLDPRPG